MEVADGILQSSGATAEEFQAAFEAAIELLGPSVGSVFGGRINDVGTLMYLLDLAQFKDKLGQIDGFDLLAKQLRHGFQDGSWFVLRTAMFLSKRAGVQVLEFEPQTQGMKRTDLRISVGATEAFVECKAITPADTGRDIRQRVIEKFRFLRPDTVELSILFRQEMADHEWESVLAEICRRAGHVTGQGPIINNDNLEVIATPAPGETKDIGIRVHLEGTTQSIDTGEQLPMSLFGGDGKPSIAVAGPALEAKPFLKAKVNAAAKQAPASAPYLLAIDVSGLPIGIPELNKALLTEFQPDINTRFSGALLLQSGTRTTKGAGTPKSELYTESFLVANPFGRYPIPNAQELLVRNQ